jgi:hypothetical protein
MKSFFLWDGSGKFKTQGVKGQIRKIQKKTRKKEWRKEKKRDFYIHGGSHICVFSIGKEHPWATTAHVTLPQENPLVWETSFQQKVQ